MEILGAITVILAGYLIAGCQCSTLFRDDPAGMNPIIGDQFNYELDDAGKGPRSWYHRWSSCRGGFQSPIDINTSLVQHHLPHRIYYNDENSLLRGDIVNNGHSMTFYPDPESRLLAGVPGVSRQDVFVMNQLHLHWGPRPDAGSEHALNGRRFPMEVHLLHYNAKYGNVLNASKQEDGLAAIAIFLELKLAPFNELDKYICFNAPHIVKPDSIKGYLNPSIFMPDLRYFYTYKGSKSTPPCNDNIRWIIMRQHGYVSYLSYVLLHRLLDKRSQLIAEHGNCRPTQPLGCRVVEANF